MSLITFSGVGFAYGYNTIFDRLSLVIEPGARIGVVGPNGAGKSTLLRLIAGDVAPAFGSISRAPGLILGALRQEALPDDGRTLIQVASEPTEELRRVALGLRAAEAGDAAAALEFDHLHDQYIEMQGPACEIRARQVLDGLGFAAARWNESTAHLSGGEKVRLGLARILVQQPDVMLLDEPTNHVDWQVAAWLQDYLKVSPSAIVAVSHDRHFLDHFAEAILNVSGGAARRYQGNYSRYVTKRAAEDEELERRRARQLDELKKQEAIVQRLRTHRKYVSMHSRERMVDRIKAELEQTPDRKQKAGMRVRTREGARSGQEVLTARKLCAGFGQTVLVNRLELDLRRGEKLAVVGPNGAGKTTLLKVLAAETPPLSGMLTYGHRVEPAYFAQDLSLINDQLTPLENMLELADINLEEALRSLHRFLFTREMVERPAAGLSGGEKTRLALCALLASGPNLLLLDEPTNHLDLPSREAVEQALKSFSGAAVIVSHDRYLVQSVADRVLTLLPGGHRLTEGFFDWWKAPSTAPEVRTGARQAPEAPGRAGRRISPQKQIERLEKQIAYAEEEVAELEKRAGDPILWRDQPEEAARAQAEAERARGRLADLYSEWDLTAETIQG